VLYHSLHHSNTTWHFSTLKVTVSIVFDAHHGSNETLVQPISTKEYKRTGCVTISVSHIQPHSRGFSSLFPSCWLLTVQMENASDIANSNGIWCHSVLMCELVSWFVDESDAVWLVWSSSGQKVCTMRVLWAPSCVAAFCSW
jgi:hypothetical protein